MSYMDDVSNRMKKKAGSLNSQLSSEKDRLRENFAGEARGRMHSDPPMSRMPINAIADKRKSRQRLDKIRTAVRAGAEGPSSSVKNTNRKSPRYGQYYSIEAGQGGNYHVYKGGKKVFVRSRPKAKSIAPNKTTNKLRKQFNPKKGLHNKEYLIDA